MKINTDKNYKEMKKIKILYIINICKKGNEYKEKESRNYHRKVVSVNEIF